jgi:hypothetical protein
MCAHPSAALSAVSRYMYVCTYITRCYTSAGAKLVSAACQRELDLKLLQVTI